MEKINWKIIQTDYDEYILLSDSNTIKKIKGKSATEIITVLEAFQHNMNIDDLIDTSKNFFHDKILVEDIIEWLTLNDFIHLKKKKSISINIIGEFGNQHPKITNFIESLPESIVVDMIYNLSVEKSELSYEVVENHSLTLLIGPFFYNKINIEKVCKLQQKLNSDFLYIELFNNGILLGPLMNHTKETVCLNCIEKRRLFNFSKPNLIIENIIDKKKYLDQSFSVFDIGNFDFNKIFIYNELLKIGLKHERNLYNKSVFIDLTSFENQNFKVFRTPNCEICNRLVIYNPI